MSGTFEFLFHFLRFTETILCIADSPDEFPFKVRQGILEAALGCEVFDAQRVMIQKRLFEVWDRTCWENTSAVDEYMIIPPALGGWYYYRNR